MSVPSTAAPARLTDPAADLVLPVLAAAMALSSAFSSWLASSTPLGVQWYLGNGVLHLACLAWLALSVRYRSPGTPLLLSATFLTVVPLLCYGSLAVALLAGQTSSLIVLRLPGPADFTYVTWAAVVVTIAALVVTFGRFVGVRGRPDDVLPSADVRGADAESHKIPDRLADTFWWFGLALFVGSLACYAVFSVVQGRSPLDYGLFFGEVSSQTSNELEVLPQFLLAGIDLGIPAVLYLVLGTRRRLTRRLVALSAVTINLVVFANMGFKYRLVVVAMALAIVLETRRFLAGRVRQTAALALVALALVGFFVVQVRRGDSENRRETTIESYTDAEYSRIVTSSVDIVTPYAALHASKLPLLKGKSYYEVPRLLVPRMVWPGKPLPSTVTVLNRVVTPDTGAVFPLWAEADVNFGLLGLALFGLLLGRLVTWTDSLPNTVTQWLVARALITAVLPSVLSRPMFFWVVQQVIFVVGPALFLVWWLARRERVAARSGPRFAAAH